MIRLKDEEQGFEAQTPEYWKLKVLNDLRTLGRDLAIYKACMDSPDQRCTLQPFHADMAAALRSMDAIQLVEEMVERFKSGDMPKVPVFLNEVNP
jgi:hypothetical protein